jgi:3-oxoadipate enol-lactonase
MPWLSRPDGCRLYYELHGPPGGIPLVLLEGMGGDIPGWRRSIPRLAERRRVIAWDLRGNGRSDDPPGRVTITTFIEDTAGLLDELWVGEAHLYGMSFGGMVAMEMALTVPDRVRSLVLAATHAGRARMVRPGRGDRVPKDRAYLALYSATFAAEHPEHIAEDLRMAVRHPRPLHDGRRQWDALRTWDAWDRLGRIAAPTLVLHGTEDRIVPVENARRLARVIPGAELVLLEGAGHVYHSEQPAEADRAVLAFIDRVERVGSGAPA